MWWDGGPAAPWAYLVGCSGRCAGVATPNILRGQGAYLVGSPVRGAAVLNFALRVACCVPPLGGRNVQHATQNSAGFVAQCCSAALQRAQQEPATGTGIYRPTSPWMCAVTAHRAACGSVWANVSVKGPAHDAHLRFTRCASPCTMAARESQPNDPLAGTSSAFFFVRRGAAPPTPATPAGRTKETEP